MIPAGCAALGAADKVKASKETTDPEDITMLLYISAPHLFPDVAPIESQVEATEATVTAPVATVQMNRSKLAMVWHKEFDGKRERMVARWVVDR